MCLSQTCALGLPSMCQTESIITSFDSFDKQFPYNPDSGIQHADWRHLWGHGGMCLFANLFLGSTTKVSSWEQYNRSDILEDMEVHVFCKPVFRIYRQSVQLRAVWQIWQCNQQCSHNRDFAEDAMVPKWSCKTKYLRAERRSSPIFSISVELAQLDLLKWWALWNNLSMWHWHS